MDPGQNFPEKGVDNREEPKNMKSIHFDVHNELAGSQILT